MRRWLSRNNSQSSKRVAGLRGIQSPGIYFRRLGCELLEERTLLSISLQYHHLIFDPATSFEYAAGNAAGVVEQDVVSPVVTGTTPSLTDTTLRIGATTLAIDFNRAVLGADTAANYQLQSVGPDGLLGTADDPIVPLTVAYMGTTATLAFAGLPENVYRLTLRDTITDIDGNRLDGDDDGTAGGDWDADFVVGMVGSGGFTPVTTLAPGTSSPWKVVTADFNGDGKLDLAVSSQWSNGVGILLGNGSGGFSASATVSSGGPGLAAGDFNGDGKVDLAVTNSSGNAGVLLGAGNGSFAAPVWFSSGGSGPFDVAVADFDGDGNLDLAVTNQSSSTVGILLGDGGGSFAGVATYSSGGSGLYSLAVGDLNGDTKPDLIVTSASGTVGVLLGSGTGSFSAAGTFAIGGASLLPYVAVGDFNADGKLDVAVASYNSNSAAVLLGNGSGGLGAATTYSSGGTNPTGIATADFNGDGCLDLVVTNYGGTTVGVLLGDGAGSFAAATTYNSGGTSPNTVAVGDFNGDGQPDLASANAGGNTVGILLNMANSSAIALNSPHAWPFEVAIGTFGAGELIQGYNNAFDGDGRLMIDGTLFQPNTVNYSLADSGQSVLTGVGTFAGLTVSREITVPNTGDQDFARTVDVFANPTGSPITTAVTVVGNLGSDATTAVFATSDGDTMLESGDLWIGTDDATDNGGTPAVIHDIHGPGALKPTSVEVVGDNVVWTYNLTVPAGQSVRLGYLTIIAATRAAAVAAANTLVTPTGFGGQAAAFLTASELQSLVNFINTNNAPELMAVSPPMGVTDENTPITVGLSGTFINNGPASTTITDLDEAALVGGIALVGTTGHGVWSYSLDGTTFNTIGSVSTAAALLLPSTAQLRYTPDTMNGETPTITYRAWDQTYGTPGTRVDTTISGGVTAFSAAMDTASLIVTDVNDAPTLLITRPSLGATTKDLPITISLLGVTINHGTGTTTIADVDNGAIVGGIALAATTGYGVWSYTLDGSTFNPVGTVSAAAALLLPGTAQLRYKPDGIHGETATIGYHAWDTTSGTLETKIDTTGYAGGTTAISLDWDIASLVVNDAPVLNAASPSLGTTDENTIITISLSGSFINAGSGTTTIIDVDDGAVVGGIALVGTTGRGVWSYSLDGTTFSTVGVLGPSTALLLPRTALLRYAPDLMNGETPTITYRAWDTINGTAGTKVSTTVNGGTTAFSLATDTATLTVADVNDAPVLTSASPSLGITNQSGAITINLADAFINHGTKTTAITDVDHGATLGEIALVGVTSRNGWLYSLDGTTFNPVGTVSTSSALLLPNTAQLRYLPDGIQSETATITYLAWDATSGTSGSKVSTLSHGGTTAFSTATDRASLVVDYTPPTVISTTPSLNNGTLSTGTATLAINFSEVEIGADIAVNYQLHSVGSDGLLGTADDVLVPLAVSYSGTTATLAFSPLPENVYRLIVRDTITDRAGNKLDGNGDGLASGNWASDFVVVPSGAVFGGATTVACGSSPYGIAAGDFNGDGAVDLVVANSTSNGMVQILFGSGNGGFSAGGSYGSGGSAPRTVAVADFNNDGRLDIVAANYGSGNVGILYGNGSGAFLSVVTYSTVGWTQGLAIGDFNGDGKPDIATTNWGGGTVGILLSTSGDGFTASSIGTGDSWPDDIAAADFNGDGMLDLVVANGSSNNVRILLGNGSGGFSIGNVYGSGVSWTQGIAVGDFNGDGNMDVVTSGVSSSNVGVLLGNGQGGLGTVTTFATNAWGPFGLTTADFNGDGKLDIAVSNSSGSNVGVFPGNGNGSFSTATNFSTGGTSPRCIVAGDFNGDGRPDLAVTNNSSGTVGMLLNFNGPTPVTLNSPHSLPFNVAVGGFGAGELLQGSNNAFDGDGRLIVGGAPYRSTTAAYSTADSGRSIITGNGTVAGLTVSRKITVPSTGNEDFARTIDTFTNSTASAITTTVTIVGNLGSDGNTTVFGTSDGDATVEASDQWIGTDDGDGTGTPAIIHYIHGPTGLQPSSVAVVGDNVQWTYTLTVEAGQTVRLASYTIMSTTRAGAIAAANALVSGSGFGGQAAAFLAPNEVALLANFGFDTTAPTVTRVLVRSSDWSSQFLDALGGIGYAVSDGASQVLPLPWGNLNQVIVEFSEDVIVTQDDLTVLGVNAANCEFSAFAYDASTHRATWTLHYCLAADKLLVDLNGSSAGVTDLAGNRLDGEWTNPTWNAPTAPTGGDAWPSGNGVAGGNFQFRLNVLPGDANRSGTTDATDLNTVLSYYNKTGMTGFTGDFNGEGRTDATDLNTVLSYYNQQLPAAEPTANVLSGDANRDGITGVTDLNAVASYDNQQLPASGPTVSIAPADEATEEPPADLTPVVTDAVDEPVVVAPVVEEPVVEEPVVEEPVVEAPVVVAPVVVAPVVEEPVVEAPVVEEPASVVIDEPLVLWVMPDGIAETVPQFAQAPVVMVEMPDIRQSETPADRICHDRYMADCGRRADPVVWPVEGKFAPAWIDYRAIAIDSRVVDQISLSAVAERELGGIGGFDSIDGLVDDLINRPRGRRRACRT